MKRLITSIAVAAVGLAAVVGAAAADPRRDDPIQLFFGVLIPGQPYWYAAPVPPIRYISPFDRHDDDDDDGWRRNHDDDDDDGWRHDDDD